MLIGSRVYEKPINPSWKNGPSLDLVEHGMRLRLCPIFGKPARLLPDCSGADAYVDYFRCDDCHQVWSHLKHNPESPAKLVTSPKDSR